MLLKLSVNVVEVMLIREGLKKIHILGVLSQKGGGVLTKPQFFFLFKLGQRGPGGGQNHIIHIYFLVEKCKKESPYGLFEVFFDIVIPVTYNLYHI